jgi:hypothetical protein
MTSATSSEDLVEALSSMHRLVSRDPRDWAVDRHDAFIYGLFVGWDCDADHEHIECRERAAAIAERHNWDGDFVSRLHRLHVAVHQATFPAGES